MTTCLPDLPPMRLGEVVLRTGQYDVMKAWYRAVLGIDASLEHASKAGPLGSDPSKPSRMCFFRLHVEHPYQDVIAIFEMGIPEALRPATLDCTTCS